MSADSPGTISRDEVAHLARLARLAVTDRELDLFAGQLDVILGAVARVGEVAADEIPPTSHAVPLENVFRPDERRPGLTQEQAAKELGISLRSAERSWAFAQAWLYREVKKALAGQS